MISALYTYLPAYFANASPVVLGGGPPLDGGSRWSDGRPLLGDHKTIKGTFYGILVGIIVGVLQGNIVGGSMQAVGAIAGDIIVSFLKRRIDLVPGESFPVGDQLDFIVFAVILSYPFQNTSWGQIVTILLITLPIHYAVNYIAWLTKLKEHPW
ncbi:MAG: CDP-2,3-bis-(O-geranylgeranyl)-sn-glycerol synthase [Candidatus Bathyarchaeota archaeon]|nr:CDP-2,3-bis-(O-geranylgeranyl)-sn-glycerol synthase [Candidatus Bathyarchaeota archaeon]